MITTKLTIVTPERTVYADDVSQVTIPTQDGEITVLPHHVPLVSVLKPGELLIRKGNEEIPLAVSGGMVQVRVDGVIILADTAERVEEIIEERAIAAQLRAQELLTQKDFDVREYAAIASRMEKELARVNVVRKYRHKTHSSGFDSSGA
ncbi:MAG: ATP synthase F1 subunit epsilon [bacterium]|nr:ATP synthase F1 subunit epsilon [bacterium]